VRYTSHLAPSRRPNYILYQARNASFPRKHWERDTVTGLKAVTPVRGSIARQSNAPERDCWDFVTLLLMRTRIAVHAWILLRWWHGNGCRSCPTTPWSVGFSANRTSRLDTYGLSPEPLQRISTTVPDDMRRYSTAPSTHLSRHVFLVSSLPLHQLSRYPRMRVSR
jgi:hypothetical protein